MKYQLFTYQAENGGSRAGIAVEGGLYDLHYAMQVGHGGQAQPGGWASLDQLLPEWPQASAPLSALAGRIVADAGAYAPGALNQPRFLAPLTRCGVVYAAGANYSDHVQAMAKAMNMSLVTDPKSQGIDPWHFIKAGQATLAAHKEDVAMPEHTEKLDWEAELAVIIGRRASCVSVEQALEHVAGYSCANDLSARDNLRREAVDAGSPFRFDWIGHKCFKGSCPIGPFMTPAEFIATPEALDIKLWLNDELKQNSNTRNHLYSVAEQISYLSHRLDLLPGDILLTGTPAGVGMETGVFLKRGDVMRVGIEGLGELETRIV